MWEEKEFIDPFDKDCKYFWMKVEQLGRYLFARDEINKISYLSPRVCDMGSASGYGSRILAEKAGEVIGLEKNPVYLAKARESEVEGVSFCECDLEANVPRLGKFDYVVAFEVLEHLEDVSKALEFVKDSLSDRGAFICSLPNPDYESVDAEGRPMNNYHKRVYKREDALKLFESFGFACEQILAQPYPNIFSKLEARHARKNRLTLNSSDDELFKREDVIRYFAQLFAYPTEELAQKSYSFVYLLKKRL